jgi:hypothetical protein
MNQTYKDALLSFHYRINAFAEENPQKLSHVLSAASKEDIVVEDYRPYDLTKEVISIYASYPDELEELMEGETFVDDISEYTLGDNYNSTSRQSRFGINCDCERYDYDPMDGCYSVCLSGGSNYGYCMDVSAENYGEDAPCEYKGSGFSFTNIGNQILGIVDDIGFDNVFNWLTGNDNNDTPQYNQPNLPPTPTPTANKTDWGKIALYGGGVLVLGIGIYLLVRKRK